MRVKLYENLSQQLCEVIAKLHHDVDSVFDERLSGASDSKVLKAATSQDRILFTLDSDFLNFKVYPLGSHSGVVVFRPSRQGTLAVMKFVKSFVQSADLRKHYRRTTIVERTRIRVFK